MHEMYQKRGADKAKAITFFRVLLNPPTTDH